MKKSLSLLILIASFPLGHAASNDEVIVEKEKAAWQAFKDRNADELKKLLSADMTAIYAEGPSDLKGELASMKEHNLKSFAISDFKAISPDSDTIVTTYKVTYEATGGGKEISGTDYAASVWRKMGGDWKMIFRTDMKAQTAAK